MSSCSANDVIQPQPSTDKASACRDRLSALPDDILLSIVDGLGDLRAAVRVSALSRRWRRIPSLLPDLAIDVADFTPPRHDDGDGLPPDAVAQAMAACARAATRLLLVVGASRRRSVSLRLYLPAPADTGARGSIGRALEAAAIAGSTGLLELDILTEQQDRHHRSLSRRRFVLFRAACPVAFSRLTKLALHNIALDLPALLGACEELRVLSLSRCDLGGGKSVVEIDAPRSQLVALELRCCLYGRLELLRLPGLRRVCCHTWYGGHHHPPLRFGRVPQLRAISLVSHARSWQPPPFPMSDCWLPPAAGNLSTLTLDFLDGAIWIKPEDPKLLSPAFSNIRDMFLCNIFAESDLSWTLFLLEAAPSLKNLYITLSRHECRTRYKGSATKTAVLPERAASSFFVHHGALRLLEIVGYAVDATLERYIKLVMERAVCLERIRLLPQEPCDRCSAERYRLWEYLQRFHVTMIHEREFVLTYMHASGHPYRPWKYPSTERDKGETRRRLLSTTGSSSVKIVVGHIGEGRRGAMVREVDAFLGRYIFPSNY